MIALIFGIVLFSVLLLSLSAQKTYAYVPIKELKRQARAGDGIAQVLYGAVSYGFSLKLVLWTLIGLSAAGSLWCLQTALPGWLTFLVVVFLLWLCFLWLPGARLSARAVRIVTLVTPALTKLLHAALPVLDRVSAYVQRHRPVTVHTGLYERADLIDLLHGQSTQADSRIPAEDLVLAEHALTFGDKRVRDCLVPRRMVTAVKQTDLIGPILLDELHAAGHSRFPVYDTDEQQAVVGILYLRQALAARHGGKVEHTMQTDVLYVHEEHDLRQVLHAFLTTKQHLFIVVNEFEEYVGIITVEDVLAQILGQPITGEFDRYDDLRAVAHERARIEHAAHHEPVADVVE